MERRRQAHTKVDINALLIGEKTVPKGCRVMNVSQSGMQLQCDDDGRLMTFKSGDNVDVFLSIQYQGRQKKLTIPSWVRHVSTNSVDVEFHKPDSALIDLVESYRSSEKHKIEASLGRADRRAPGHRPPQPDVAGRASARTAAQEHKPPVRPFYSILLATVFIACVITGGYVYTASIDSRISTLESLGKQQATELSEIQSRVFSASLQEGRYASLDARMTALNDAFVSLENRLAGILPASSTQTAPVTRTNVTSPATTPADTGDRARQETARAGDDVPTVPERGTPLQQDTRPADETPPGVTTQATADTAGPPAEQVETAAESDKPANTGKSPAPAAKAVSTPAGTVAGSGPWVINLISSPDRAYVESFSRERNAARYNAVLNEAKVRGRQYWRLQITGFESATAAKRQAATVKQGLGIKDVWIFREE